MAPPWPVPLAPLLAARADVTDTDSAFARLFALWRADYVAGAVDACEQAARQKLECLVERGSFGQLQVYNRPAILTLNDSQGASHQVVLTALRDEDASIDVGGTQAVVSIAELSRYWLGDFVLLWRPDTATVKPLAVGTRGDELRSDVGGVTEVRRHRCQDRLEDPAPLLPRRGRDAVSIGDTAAQDREDRPSREFHPDVGTVARAALL